MPDGVTAAATPLAALQAIDPSINANTLSTITAGLNTYSIVATKGGCVVTEAGPGADPTLGAGC